MPIWLKNFTHRKIIDFYEAEQEAAKGKPANSTPAMGPNIKKPSYSTKARK